MNPVAEDFKDVLVGAGLGTFASSSGWSIHVGRYPEKPDTVICLTDSGGYPSNPAFLIDHPTVQVMVRGTPNGLMAAYYKIVDIRRVLLGRPPEVINGARYVGVWEQSPISLVGWDDKGRPLHTLNFRVTREPAQEIGDHREEP
ncbi:MAG: minor capsid protein [Thermodesulfobacteriota bacterium]